MAGSDGSIAVAALLQHNKSGKNILQMDTQALRTLCINRKAIPHEFFIEVMLGNMKCRTCKGKGLKRYRLSEKRQAPCACENPAHCWRCNGTGTQIWNERVCQSCRGDGDEVISPETSLNAAAHLAKYVAPQLKQVDHVSSDDSQGVKGIRVVFVDAKQTTIINEGTSAPRLNDRK
jgi:hypothetical protein